MVAQIEKLEGIVQKYLQSLIIIDKLWNITITCHWSTSEVILICFHWDTGSPSIVAPAHFMSYYLKFSLGYYISSGYLLALQTKCDIITPHKAVWPDRLIVLMFLLPQDRDIYFGRIIIWNASMLYPKLGEVSRMIACYKFEFKNLNMAMFRFILLDWDKLQ